MGTGSTILLFSLAASKRVAITTVLLGGLAGCQATLLSLHCTSLHIISPLALKRTIKCTRIIFIVSFFHSFFHCMNTFEWRWQCCHMGKLMKKNVTQKNIMRIICSKFENANLRWGKLLAEQMPWQNCQNMCAFFFFVKSNDVLPFFCLNVKKWVNVMNANKLQKWINDCKRLHCHQGCWTTEERGTVWTSIYCSSSERNNSIEVYYCRI